MLQQGAWTFRYSLEGFLKRTLFAAGTPLAESVLIDAVLSNWAGSDELSRETLPDRVRAALRARSGAFRPEGEEGWTLRDAQGDELHRGAYAFLKDASTPQKQGDILRHLQAATGRGRGELMSRLDLEADLRFARLETGEWLLTEWELINDAVATLMVESEQRRASRQDLLDLFGAEQGQQFLPELDPRFAVVGDQVECLLVESLAAATAPHTYLEESEEKTMNATAVEFQQEEQETKVPTHALVDMVLAQLTITAKELQSRNQEIPTEVMALFNEEDLKGIEALMLQRKRLEALAEDLQGLVRKWTEGQQ
ncbi:MAG: hypothetical protein WCC10_03755 [Tumebacillaceae bacterium]